MIELSNERIEQMLHDETKKTEALPTLLRCIYTRYMYLFGLYFDNLETLNDDKIAEFKKYHAETQALIRYYYMDIPQDVCSEIREFEEKGTDNLLGREWKKNLYDTYEKFKNENSVWDMSENYYMAEFKKEAVKGFYEAMEKIFRSGFGTESETEKRTLNGLSGLLFGGRGKD